jgi:hypothetical protein
MYSLDIKNELSLSTQLKILSLPALQRKKILTQVAKQARTNSRQRITKQQDLDGRAFQKRKPQRPGGKRKGKLLKNLAKNKSLKTRVGSHSASVGYTNRLTGRIAKQQQDGLEEKWTARRYKKTHGQPDYGAAATRAQSRALLDEGFRIKRKSGNGWRTPPLKWISANLTIGKAAAVLKAMRDNPSPQDWTIKLPARSYLGASKKDRAQHVETIINNLVP